jgi:hypothetical protein
MGDAPQSGLSAVDAFELRGDRLSAGNANYGNRKGAQLRLRRLRLQARGRVAGLARA